MSADVSCASRCVLCGAPEPFGLSVCPGCGGAAHAVGDTLIFVQRAYGKADKHAVEYALADLVQGRAHRGEYDLVARGHRALIRIPGAAAETGIQHLALRGIPAEARQARRTWAPVPALFYFMLFAILVMGLRAMQEATPIISWASPAVALLLLASVQATLRRPLIAASNRNPVFTADAESCIAETFARLPDCSARALLADLVGAAERVTRALVQQPGPSTPEDIEQLVTLSCAAAIDLADLEVALDALEGDSGVEQARRLRANITERFRTAISVLHRLRAAAIAADPAHETLAELIRDLGGNADALVEAQREISLVLATPGSGSPAEG